MLELAIRPADLSNLDDILPLLAACIEEMRGRGIEQWDELYPTRDTFAADVAAGTLYAAWLDTGALAGIFTLDEHQSPEWAAVPWTILGVRTAVVHRLMVEPRYQGQGIARQLMRFAECEAAGARFEAIRLDAFSLNPQALRLYQALGYRDAGSGTMRKGVFRCFEKRLGPDAAAR
jgi:ribosomal protein S18 acetylase RimI-like enzyme